MLDITRIRYFQAVAEAGSFSRAARRLGLSQPTLSIQVARLEEEIGTPLLQRHRTGVRPTETGRRLLSYSQDIFSRLTEMEHDLRSHVDEPSGDLRIATVHSVGIFVLPEAVVNLKKRYTGVQITIHAEHSEAVLEMLHAGEVDVALTASSQPPAAAYNQLLGDDPILLVCGPGHRFWGRRYVRPADLEGEELLGLSSDSPTARLIDGILERNEVHMRPLLRTPCIGALLRMVRINMGLAFMPYLAIKDELEATRLHAVDFETNQLHRGLWASWENDNPMPAREAFVATLIEALSVRLAETS